MPLDPERLRATPIPEIEHRYGWRDCVLYALGLGVGLDPMDEDELAYVDEHRLRVQPSMANVLGYPGFWMRDPAFGLDWQRTVHGEHAVRLHRPLPTEGHVRGTSRIVGLVDKGAGRGALVYVERRITDLASGELLATVAQTVFCRGDGGFGSNDQARPAHRLPERAPDAVIELPTSPQTALIYRLSGDYNPLHSSPSSARASGFERPILHGLATFGFSGRALVRGLCGGDPAALKAMGGRFSAPVFPGETLQVELWRPEGSGENAGRGSFRTRVAERGVVVLDNGFVETA